jgi:hypothetical protein
MGQFHLDSLVSDDRISQYDIYISLYAIFISFKNGNCLLERFNKS